MIGKCNTGGGENVTPEVTAQTPVITQIAENLEVTITTPSGTNKQILQGNNANLLNIKNNAKKTGLYAWKKKTAADGDFLCFVTSDDENAYPNGDMHTDGYYYKRVSTSDLPIQYSYSGTSKLTTGFDSSNNPIWTLKLLTSGTLNISEMETTIVDTFLVGGGGGGGGGVGDNGGSSGAGGGGGYTTKSLNTPISVNTDYTVQIGAGGEGGSVGKGGSSGGKTSAFGLSANGGSGGQCGSYGYGVDGADGGAGGSGGGAGTKMSDSNFSCGKVGTGQGKSTRAFEETSEALYAGGGGGGGAYILSRGTVYAGTGGDGGSNGGSGKVGNGVFYSEASATPGAGGAGGGGNGGNGGYNGSQDGKNGTANTGGGGGGGGSSDFGSFRSGHGGAGGSGIVIIRGRYV